MPTVARVRHTGRVDTLSRDTHPAAEEVQIRLIRDATPARRISLMRSLSAFTIRLARRAIRDANPELGERDLDLLFVEIHYGAELADRVRVFLEQRT